MKKLLKKLERTDGFSLVELIVTIAIIIILVAILVPNVAAYISQATKAQSEATAKEVYNAACVYVSEEVVKGHQFSPDDTITPSVLWTGSSPLIDEPLGYDEIEVKLSSTGANVNYVYLRKGDFEVDYPRGNSGKVTYTD